MESKVVKMKEKKFDEQFNLLGYRFKKIGFVIVGLLIIGLVLFQLFNVESWPEHQDVVKSIYLRLMILGLLLIAWSREKMEDERIYIRKVKSMARTLMFISFIVLTRPLAFIFSGSTYPEMTGEALVIGMLIFQIGMFYFEKYNERFSKDEKKRPTI